LNPGALERPQPGHGMASRPIIGVPTQTLEEIPGELPRCCFCQVDEGLPHEVECTMHFVLAAIAKAEGRNA